MMATQTERLGVLETKVDTLTDDIKEVKASVKSFSAKLDTFFVTQAKLEQVEKDIVQLQSKQTVTRALVPIVSAIAASVVTFLLIEFLEGKR